MAKKLFFSVFTLIMTAAVFGLQVDKNELQSAGSDESIVFINYSGPHSKIDSLSSIKGIGSAMGEKISLDLEKENRAGNSKYSVIHAVDPSVKNGLDADIIIIGDGAAVDHIDNLRRIIASYLSSAYGYSEKDAETISVFITVYNAVYRGKVNDFHNKYKKIVTEKLSEEKCGLSVNYKDWPGKSQIVIPLFDVSGNSLSTIDTSVISDSQVVKHMQEDDGKNVESRKNMVDLKEREADEASEKARDSQKNAVQEQKKLTEEKAKTQEKKTEAEEAQKEAENAKSEAEEARKKADQNPEDKELQKEAEEQQEIAEQKQAEAAEKQAAYEEQQETENIQAEKTEEARQEAAEKQAVADKKNSEAQEERKSIAKDQQEVLQKEIANSTAPSAFAIQLVDEAEKLSGLVKINTKTGEIIKSSPVRVIRNRTVFQARDNFIAVAGENSGNGTVKLVLLSPDTMEIVKESAETVAQDSVLVQDNGEFYCIIQDDSNFVTAKYDSELNLKLKSPEAVKQATPITVSSQGVIVSGANGSVILLDKSNLKNLSAN